MKDICNLRKGEGFTLIEMMVVIFIFTTILSMVLINFRKGERLSEFRITTDQVASTLRQAQTQALTGIGTQDRMSQGYGVYFDLDTPGKYIIFKNAVTDLSYNEGDDEIIETVFLPDEVYISGLNSENFDGGPITILFEPPKPRYFLNDGHVTFSNDAEIRLSRDGFSDKVGLITLNKLTGRISSELTNVEP